MSLTTQSRQMMTNSEYLAPRWPESGTSGEIRRSFSISAELAPVAFELGGFMSLEEDWNSYGASRISRKAIERAFNFLFAFPTEMPLPEVFPTSKGGVKFEWGDDQDGVEVVFASDGGIEVLIDESGEMREATARDLDDPVILEALKWAEKLS